MGVLWAVSVFLLFMSPALVFRVWWWSFLAIERRTNRSLLSLSLSLFPTAIAVIGFIKLGSWAFSGLPP